MSDHDPLEVLGQYIEDHGDPRTHGRAGAPDEATHAAFLALADIRKLVEAARLHAEVNGWDRLHCLICAALEPFQPTPKEPEPK